jgi:hypothetical protein
MNMLSKLLLSIFVICCLSGIADAEVSGIALTGQAAPGVSGATFSFFSGASVNNSGEMAFQAELSNGASGIFKLSHGQISAIALSGQAISGSTGLSFGTMGYPAINDSGTIVFIALIQGGLQSMRGIFVASGTSLDKALDSTATIPGTGDPISSFSSGIKLNNKGDFAVLVHGSTPRLGYVLVISNGSVSSVIPFPNATAGTEIALNNNGDIVFGTLYELYLYSEGTTQQITQHDSNLWGGTLGALAINDSKEVFFTNSQRSGMGGMLLQNTLFRWRNGNVEDIVSTGVYAGIFQIYTLSVDNSGGVFFDAEFYKNNNLTHGLFLYDSGNITLLAQDGRVLPGIGTITAISSLHANDSGIVTFKANLDNGASGIFQLQAFTQLFFPQVADGSFGNQWSWRTTLMFSNPDKSSPASFTITFIQDDGTPMNVGIQGVTNSHFSFTVPASGSLQLETSGLGNLKTGWAKVQADNPISGISIYSLYDGAGNYMSEVGAPSCSSLNAFSLFAESTTDTNTGIAIVNPGFSSTEITLTLRDSQGKAVGSSIWVNLPAREHMQKYVTDLFQGIVPSDFHGRLDVASPSPILGIHLKQRQQVFTWMPLVF